MINPTIKRVSSCWLLCLVFLAACGQSTHQPAPLSPADSARLSEYNQQSISYQNTQPDSAIYFAGKGLKLARLKNNLTGEAHMLDRFARINEQYGNLALATKYQEEARSAFNRLNDQRGIADATLRLGLLDGKQQRFKTGLQLTIKALEQYRLVKDTSGMIRAYTGTGQLYDLQGDTASAMKAYNKAETLQQGRPESEDFLALMNSMAQLHARSGNHQKAHEHYQKAIKASEGKQQHVLSHLALLRKAGEAMDSMGNKSQALAYHRLSLQKAQANGLHEEEARSLMAIASTVKNEDADQSILHLKNALTIARSIGHKQLSAEIYHSLSNIYRQQSRYEDALNSLVQHHRLLDSVMIRNKGHQLAVLQNSYELAEAKLKVETLELANQQKTYQRNIYLMAAFAILLVLILLSVYFYRTRRLNRQLKASNLVKDKLFSIIGHDLRNPIGGITQTLAVMEEDELSEEHLELVTAMRKQGQLAGDILNDLLNWGKAQMQGIEITPMNFETKPLISKNIAVLHKQAADKSVRIDDLTGEKLVIFGETDHFDFIIRNLVANAIKFSFPDSTIKISADEITEVTMVIFCVEDSGKGISIEQQKLFASQNIEIKYGTSGEKGTGIGLSLVKDFLKANGGKIWLESEEGKGTRFYFSFPKARL